MNFRSWPIADWPLPAIEMSKRALAAMPALFAVPAVGSAFLLWYLTPKPDVYQIVSLTIYALFVLAAAWLVRTR